MNFYFSNLWRINSTLVFFNLDFNFNWTRIISSHKYPFPLHKFIINGVYHQENKQISPNYALNDIWHLCHLPLLFIWFHFNCWIFTAIMFRTICFFGDGGDETHYCHIIVNNLPSFQQNLVRIEYSFLTLC